MSVVIFIFLQGEKEELEQTAGQVQKYRNEQFHMRHLVVKGILESEKSYLNVIEQLVKVRHFC